MAKTQVQRSYEGRADAPPPWSALQRLFDEAWVAAGQVLRTTGVNLNSFAAFWTDSNGTEYEAETVSELQAAYERHSILNMRVESSPYATLPHAAFEFLPAELRASIAVRDTGAAYPDKIIGLVQRVFPHQSDRASREAEPVHRRLFDLAQRAFPHKLDPARHAGYPPIEDDQLRQRCGDLLTAGRHYDRAVREACVILEDRVRSATGAGREDIGPALMAKAFKPDGGLLQLSAVAAVQVGAMELYRGTMGFFRNEAGHNVMDTWTLADAWRFVGWIDLLLKTLRQATPRNASDTDP